MKTRARSVAVIAWAGLWLTPDQQGQRLFERKEFAAAAQAFHDPMWQGAAWYRAGEFEKAAQAFARRDSAEAFYNQGNAQVLLGKYDAAIASYDRALEKRPPIGKRQSTTVRRCRPRQTGRAERRRHGRSADRRRQGRLRQGCKE